MSATETAVLMDPAEFLAMDDAGYELCDGVLKERMVSKASSSTAARLFVRLGTYVESIEAGTVFGPDMGLQIFPSRPRRIPRADVVYISNERLAPLGDADFGFLTVPPEIVAEVVSRWDTASEVEGKIAEYLSAGVLAVWVVFPEQRRAHVYRADGSSSVLDETGALEGEDILPGFRCQLASVLPVAPADAESPTPGNPSTG